MKHDGWEVKAGAAALAVIGLIFAVGGVMSLWPRASIASFVTIAFGLLSIFVAVRAYLRAVSR
jgi:hypothetical protein